MEEIVKLQLTELYAQRGILVKELANQDINSINFYNGQMELRNSINQIDTEISNAVNRLSYAS